MPKLKKYAHEHPRRGKPDWFESMAGFATTGALVSALYPDGIWTPDLGGFYPFNLRLTSHVLDGRTVFTTSGEAHPEVLGFEDVVRRAIGERYDAVYGTLARPQPSQDISLRFEIAAQSAELGKNALTGNAGDQAMGIGVAVLCERAGHQPLERYLAHGIADLLDRSRKDGTGALGSLLAADGKVYVSGLFREDGSVEQIEKIVIAAQQALGSTEEQFPSFVDAVTRAVHRYLEREDYGIFGRISGRLRDARVKVNTAGLWVNGNQGADGGDNQAKSHLQSYGSRGSLTDTLCGEDFTKADGVCLLYARKIASSIVASERARYAKVTVETEIGRPDLGIFVETDGTQWRQKRANAYAERAFGVPFQEAALRLGLANSATYERIVEANDTLIGPHPWNVL